MSEWRDISTAPRDGTKVLLGRFTYNKSADREGYIAVDWYRTPQNSKVSYIGFGEFNTTHWPPTHWMPLPEPPND